jgi:hypothetical protein
MAQPALEAPPADPVGIEGRRLEAQQLIQVGIPRFTYLTHAAQLPRFSVGKSFDCRKTL